MTERTPEAELHPCERLLILDTWAAHPVFHAGVLYFTDDEPPNGTSFADRIAAPMPDLPWRHNALTTRCGNLLRVHLWLEDVTVRKTGSEAVADHRWSTPLQLHGNYASTTPPASPARVGNAGQTPLAQRRS